MCVLGKSHPPCPLPLTLQHCLPPTHARTLSVSSAPSPHCMTLFIPAYLVPAVLEATQSLQRTDSRPTNRPGLGSSGREGPGEREGSRGGAAASAILSC